jgi:hypothetical protein
MGEPFDRRNLGRVLLVHKTYAEKKWGIPGGIQEDRESAWKLQYVNVKKK